MQSAASTSVWQRRTTVKVDPSLRYTKRWKRKAINKQTPHTQTSCVIVSTGPWSHHHRLAFWNLTHPCDRTYEIRKGQFAWGLVCIFPWQGCPLHYLAWVGPPPCVHYGYRLVGLVVKASVSRAEDPGFESPAPCCGIFSGSSHTSDLKTGTPVATLPGAWRYRVSAGTGRPGVSILWLGEAESVVCNFCLSVAARKLVWADPSLRYTSMLLGR